MPTPPVNPLDPATQQSIAETVSKSNELREALAKAAEAARNLGSNMKENLEYAGKTVVEFEKNKTKLDELTDKINSFNQALQSGAFSGFGTTSQIQEFERLIQTVDTGVEKRKKLGEETQKLNDLVRDYESNQNGISKQDVLNQQSRVDALSVQLEKYRDILGDQQKLEQLVGAELAIRLRQYIVDKNLTEQAETYQKNHEDAYYLTIQTLNAEELLLARRIYEISIMEKKLENLRQSSFLYGQISKISTEIGNALGFQKITLGAVIKGAFDLNKIFVDNAKQLGTTREVTKQIAGDVADQSAKAGTLASYGTQDVQTRKNALEAQAALNKSLGTAAMYSSERLRDQNFLTKIMGLEVEDAVKVQQLSLVSGKTNKEIVDSVNNQVIGLGKQTGIYLDNRKVLADVAKVSGQLASQYKNNPELIAQAVVKVQQLGMNLEQAATSSNKLLNFSDSLAKELEAELLTGKAINLEQARYYALMGDSAKAAEELMANIGGLEEFNRLNVLQQRAYAEAVGMSADELANSLKTQELLKQTGDASLEALNERRRIAVEEGKSEEFLQELRRAGTSEEMIANQSQLASQDKLNALVEKTLEMFSTMVEPMTQLVGKAVDFVNALGGAKTLVGIIGGLWVGKIAASIATTGVQLVLQTAMLSAQVGIARTLANIAKEKAAAEAIAASASTLGLATPVIIGGAAAIIAGLGIAASFGAFSGGGEEKISEKMNEGRREAPSRENSNITIQSKFTLNNRDLGYVATSTNVGTQRRFDS